MTETLARPVAPAAEERARLKEGVHIERSSRRVRTYFGNKLIADSEHVLLVYETKRPPAYWFPIADVRMCQSASNFAPRSASKIDPILETRADGSARRGEAGLGCAAWASADRLGAVIVRSGAVLEAPTLIAGLDDVAVVGETIEECGGHLWVAEHARPFAEGEIGGDDDRGAFVEPADEME